MDGLPFKILVRGLSEATGGVATENLYQQEVVRIGRKETSDIRLIDPRRLVSGQHAEIRRKDRNFFLIDLGSKNGTCLNDAPVESGKEYPVGTSDRILIGDFIIQIASPGEASAVPTGEKPVSKPEISIPVDLNLELEVLSPVLKIAARYLKDPKLLNDPDAEAQLAKRMNLILPVILRGLCGLLQGRRSFEKEFDAEATRIFSWKLNPIKLAEEEREIGEYLFDVGKAPTEKVVAELEEVFSDLALHQMGMMAGIKESIAALLDILNPEQIEKDADKKLWHSSGVAAWEEFKRKYKGLTENEVNTFEKTLGPGFSKGYLSVQQKKKKHG